MMIYIQLLKESFNFAIKSLRDNKLRTFLSLLGVTVGIFSIISVLSAVDSLNKNIKENLSGLDKNLITISKFSFGPTSVPRWQRLNFPQVTYQEFEFLNKNLTGVEVAVYELFGVSTAMKYGGKTIQNARVKAVSAGADYLENLKVEKGRFFTESEANTGAAVAVIGYEIAEQLFGDENPIDREIRAFGRKLTVIGVFKKYGENSVNSVDRETYAPVNFVRNFVVTGANGVPCGISLKPKENTKQADLEQDITQKLRTYRALKPDEIDNFFINKVSSFMDMIDETMSLLNLVGWVVGGFSILVGGFGIANIMFVSVKERTSLIGIQKSLGAKNRFILFQFLFEAVLLAVIGGIFGLFFVWIATILASNLVENFAFVLSFPNVLIGLGVSFSVGLISGILPALTASKLNPVEAIRTGQ